MSTPTKKIAFHTLGCKLNFSETSSISRDFIEHGYEKVAFKDFADIYVINTCSVTENADKETKKLVRRIKRINPYSYIALMGCYAQLKPDELIALDGVNMVIGAEEKFNLLTHLDKIKINNNEKLLLNNNIKNVTSFNPSVSYNDRTRSFLKVQDGCDYHCTFCTIPKARGKSRSGSIDKILQIAEKIAKTDTKEIVLTGVNIGDFGVETEESFLDLIKKMDMLNGIDRIRISSIEPNLLSDEIIKFCSKSEKFMPHFHIPLQSGSDKILLSNSAGSVTYSNGYISITSFKPDSFTGSTLDFTIQPAVNDLVPIRNQIFDVSNTNITVTMQDDAGTGTTVTSTTAAGTVSSTTTGTSTGSTTTY